MDDKKIIDGMKKLREAIGDFIDNMAIDEADEEIKAKAKAKKAKAKKAKAKESGDSEKEGEEDG